MAHHILKCTAPFFQQVKKEEKTAEVRINDRNFKVGDTIELVEYIPGEQFPSGYTNERPLYRRITNILYQHNGLVEGYCVMSISLLEIQEHATLLASTKEANKYVYGLLALVGWAFFSTVALAVLVANLFF